MKLHAATDLFKRLSIETDRKSEIKIYERFIGLISNLEERRFTHEELQAIEKKLDELDLKSNPENRIKYFRNRLNELKKYLRDNFSLISEGYYTGIGISLGVAFGAAFGSVFKMGVGVALGMMIGLVIGAYMDEEAKKQNRVLKSKLG
ncbi:MAG: hypothetical protein IPL65_07660 [Lewinellaceae bacterium]|nr:hypothetical protein [Lewinellaceae bacterium]